MSTLSDRLKRDPEGAAKELAQRDPWVLQHLHHAFDTTAPPSLDELAPLEQAIRALGGRLSPSQRLKLATARDEAA